MSVERPDLCLREPPDLPFEHVEWFKLSGHYNGGIPPADVSTLRGADILAQAILKKNIAMKALALLHNPKSYGGEPMRCFIPRHGFRFSSSSAQVDILICFECYWIYFFHGPKKVIASLNDGSRSALEHVFDEAFKAEA